MIDRVEKICQVDIHRESLAVIDRRLHLLDRLVRNAAGSKAETRILKRRIENQREHLGDGLLNHTVGDRGRFANSPSKRLPPSALGISTLRTACTRDRDPPPGVADLAKRRDKACRTHRAPWHLGDCGAAGRH